MENIVASWEKLKKVTEEYIRIPMLYILFIALNIFIYLEKGHKISSLLTSNFVLKNLFDLVLGSLSMIYGNYLNIVLFLFIVVGLVLLLFEKTSLFDLLPEDVEYTNGYTESWNPISAAKRLFSLILNLSTNLFIIYISILFIIDPDKFFIENNFIVIKKVMGETSINFLWYLNYIIVIFMIHRSLFVIKYKADKHYLKLSGSRYSVISSFNVSNEWKTICTMIVKDTYNFKQYYLLEGETHRREQKEMKVPSFGKSHEKQVYWEKVEIPIAKRSYKILDKSENLSDIVYYYDEFKKRRTT
ncbi:hypothetical protein [Streptococcus pluranimalium]|uniref:hypothetical protein n=1 Tax=Streptococcus pluranimalium TaxID=82348 RepID=UPI003F691F6E